MAEIRGGGLIGFTVALAIHSPATARSSRPRHRENHSGNPSPPGHRHTVTRNQISA